MVIIYHRCVCACWELGRRVQRRLLVGLRSKVFERVYSALPVAWRVMQLRPRDLTVTHDLSLVRCSSDRNSNAILLHTSKWSAMGIIMKVVRV